MIRGFAKQMAVALTMGGALFAVACGDGDTKVVEIESPRAGATLTRIDDIDPATEGVQIEVQVAIVNEDPGEEVWLYRDANALDGLDDSELPAPDHRGSRELARGLSGERERTGSGAPSAGRKRSSVHRQHSCLMSGSSESITASTPRWSTRGIAGSLSWVTSARAPESRADSSCFSSCC